MEDALKHIKLSMRSYALVILSILSLIISGFSVEFLTQDIRTYAIFNSVFYALIAAMIYSVFIDVIHSSKNMSNSLESKLKTRLYAVVFVCMPVIAFVDMKAAMLSHNWTWPF